MTSALQLAKQEGKPPLVTQFHWSGQCWCFCRGSDAENVPGNGNCARSFPLPRCEGAELGDTWEGGWVCSDICH